MWLVLALAGLLSYLAYKWLSRNSDFWERQGMPQINIFSIFDYLSVFLSRKIFADFDEIVYKKIGSQKYVGMMELGTPVMLIKDMELVKKVLIKDFDHFVDRRTFSSSENQKVVDKMVINLQGEEWKGVRSSLSPTFTTGKIRRMMDYFNNVSNDWIKLLNDGLSKSGNKTLAVNIDKQAVNFTVEAISAAVFGMNAGTIQNPDATFARMAHKLNSTDLIDIIRFGIALSFPKLIKLFNIPLINSEALSFYEKLLSQGIKARREEGSTKRNDFLQLLIEASKGNAKAMGSDDLSHFEKDAEIKVPIDEKKNWLADDEIINASMLLFFFAGFSTTSNFIGFALYMLALHPEVQTKLRDELNSYLFNKDKGENVDYDELGKLIYLDMVVCEVLRKYPAASRLERQCVKEYYDASTGLKVPKGTLVAIPVQAIHNDRQFYEHPDKFYPEHFTPEKKATRGIQFLSFGSGPRNCIGMRFALIEGKSALAHIIHNFIIEPTSKTPVPATDVKAGLSVQLPKDLELGFRSAK